MPPDSLGAEIAALAAAVIAAAVLSLTWGAGRGRRRIAIRAAAVAACLTAASASGLLWVNSQVDVYPTWASLFGATTETAGPVPVTPSGGSGAGRIVSLTVAGRASGLALPMYVYLPPGYAARPRTRFPVIEALDGYPGSPLQWFNRLDVATVLNDEIRAGRMAPTVVVFPYQTPDPMLDTECADLVGGPRAETFLTVDVPSAARAHLRVRADAAGWGLIGYSAGGYCGTDLILRHPTGYAAAAALSGYAQPGVHIGNGTEKTSYNVIWRFRHLPAPAVSLYLSCARADLGSMRDTRAIARAARAPLSVTTSYVNGGGHNDNTWRAMEAPAFDWLSTTLGRPVEPVSARRTTVALRSGAAGP